jgi:hypothetical protein
VGAQAAFRLVDAANSRLQIAHCPVQFGKLKVRSDSEGRQLARFVALHKERERLGRMAYTQNVSVAWQRQPFPRP